MEEFPSNAHKRRETPAKHVKEEVTAPEPKRVERVIEGQVIRRKKPLGKRFKEVFFGSDSQSVLQYVVMDVVIPATKDLVADVATQGVERMLWGDSYRGSRRGRRDRVTRSGYTSYDRYSSRQDDRPPFPPANRRAALSKKARANHDFDEILLATRAEAETVIERLYDLLEKYETATVADLYEMLGLTSQYTDDKWGWVELPGARARRVPGGYLLELPNPEPLD